MELSGSDFFLLRLFLFWVLKMVICLAFVLCRSLDFLSLSAISSDFEFFSGVSFPDLLSFSFLGLSLDCLSWRRSGVLSFVSRVQVQSIFDRCLDLAI